MADAKFDPRIVTVGIEVNGQLKTYEGLNLSASGTKYANAMQNEMTLQISNLNKETRDYLLTATSPYNANRGRKLVTLDAGRQSTGTFRVFAGDIVSATVCQPPDIDLNLKARTGFFSRGDIVAVSHPVTTLSSIAKSVATNLRMRLQFEAMEKKIANYAYTGSAEKQVEQLGNAGGVDAFIDDDVLVVKNKAEALANVTHVLSEDNGMVGKPELTERGIKVAMLLTPGVRLGGRLTLDSKLNPALSGDYTIYKLSFDITSRDTPFYWIAECWRPGVLFRKSANMMF